MSRDLTKLAITRQPLKIEISSLQILKEGVERNIFHFLTSALSSTATELFAKFDFKMVDFLLFRLSISHVTSAVCKRKIIFFDFVANRVLVSSKYLSCQLILRLQSQSSVVTGHVTCRKTEKLEIHHLEIEFRE